MKGTLRIPAVAVVALGLLMTACSGGSSSDTDSPSASDPLCEHIDDLFAMAEDPSDATPREFLANMQAIAAEAPEDMAGAFDWVIEGTEHLAELHEEYAHDPIALTEEAGLFLATMFAVALAEDPEDAARLDAFLADAEVRCGVDLGELDENEPPPWFPALAIEQGGSFSTSGTEPTPDPTPGVFSPDGLKAALQNTFPDTGIGFGYLISDVAIVLSLSQADGVDPVAMCNAAVTYVDGTDEDRPFKVEVLTDDGATVLVERLPDRPCSTV